MPKINQDTKDQSVNQLETALNNVMIQAAQTPTVVCGVGRKVNIGHFENIDIYFGVTLPVPNADLMDLDNLKNQLSKVAAEGFAVASKETGDRYLLIKEAIGGPRPSTDTKKPDEEAPF